MNSHNLWYNTCFGDLSLNKNCGFVRSKRKLSTRRGGTDFHSWISALPKFEFVEILRNTSDGGRLIIRAGHLLRGGTTSLRRSGTAIYVPIIGCCFHIKNVYFGCVIRAQSVWNQKRTHATHDLSLCESVAILLLSESRHELSLVFLLFRCRRLPSCCRWRRACWSTPTAASGCLGGNKAWIATWSRRLRRRQVLK